MRRTTLAAISAALVLVIVAGCGGGSASPSPSEGASETEAPITTEAPAGTTAPEPEVTDAPSTEATTLYHAACGQVALREGPSADDGLVARLAKGTKVRVVEIVTGASYDGGTCGEDGDTWLKITKVAGKTTQDRYDLDAVYAAAGFFGEGQP